MVSLSFFILLESKSLTTSSLFPLDESFICTCDQCLIHRFDGVVKVILREYKSTGNTCYSNFLMTRKKQTLEYPSWWV